MSKDAAPEKSADADVLEPIETVLEQALEEAARRESALTEDDAACDDSRLKESLARWEARAAEVQLQLQMGEIQAREVDGVLEEAALLLKEWQQETCQLRERSGNSS